MDKICKVCLGIGCEYCPKPNEEEEVNDVIDFGEFKKKRDAANLPVELGDDDDVIRERITKEMTDPDAQTPHTMYKDGAAKMLLEILIQDAHSWEKKTGNQLISMDYRDILYRASEEIKKIEREQIKEKFENMSEEEINEEFSNIKDAILSEIKKAEDELSTSRDEEDSEETEGSGDDDGEDV